MMYLILKLVHVITSIIFLGNITFVPFWKLRADQSKDRLKIAETFDGIRKADKYFTMPGVILLLVFGIGAAGHAGYNFLETDWIFLSLILYFVSVVVFMVKIIPLQKKILVLCSNEKLFSWDEYSRLSKQWDLWGTVATLSPWVAVVLMILKTDF